MAFGDWKAGEIQSLSEVTSVACVPYQCDNLSIIILINEHVNLAMVYVRLFS